MAHPVAKALIDIREGKDIPAPGSLLSNISAEKASIVMLGSPYSILTNLAHAVFWQDNWLGRLQGVRAKSFTQDWKVPEDSAWDEVRVAFLTGLEKAIELATKEPFEHKMRADEIAWNTLMQIVIHDSYHLGQINLLKRQLRLNSLQG